MDLNDLLIWVVVISCGGTLARLLQSGAWRRNAWAILSAAVLAITGIIYLVRPQIAGWVGGGLWAVLFLIPSLLNRAMARATMRQQYQLAEWIAYAAALLHPADGWWEQPRLLHALTVGESGDISGAMNLLAELGAKYPHLRRVATFQSFRIARRWNELITWADLDAGPAGLARDPSLAVMYVRALGEVGAINEMVETLARLMPAMQSPAQPYTRAMARLFVFAFCGDVEQVRILCDDALAAIPADVKQFWIATAQLAAGEVVVGEQRMRKLITTGRPTIRAAAEDRLARPVVRASEVLTPLSRKRLEEMARERQQEDRFYGRIGARRWRGAATIVLIAVNLVMFGVEIYLGGSENELVLERLGAVHPVLVAHGGWWRIIAANFLHAGIAHVAFNMLALWILGPFVEAALGKVRYLIVYMFSGIVALSAAVVLQRLHLIQEDFLVGASGCIMGLVGATIAILLRARLTERAAVAAQRLRAVMVIVVVQLVFDAMTPQVSSTAHIAGMLAGFAATIFLKHRTSPPGRGFDVIVNHESSRMNTNENVVSNG